MMRLEEEEEGEAGEGKHEGFLEGRHGGRGVESQLLEQEKSRQRRRRKNVVLIAGRGEGSGRSKRTSFQFQVQGAGGRQIANEVGR